jgi:hypothetical protein
MLPLAVAAVLIAPAFAFLLIALRTKNGALHPDCLIRAKRETQRKPCSTVMKPL